MFNTRLRSHTCNDLKKEDAGKEAKLCGWVQSRRDHGGIIFVDLRDRYGLTQIVIDPEKCEKVEFEAAEQLRREDVVQVEGKVEPRKPGMTNPKLDTGEIEVFIKKIKILAKSETPPLEIDDRNVANDDVRLEYRYIDLRRPTMQKNLMLRHKIVTKAREYFNKNGFIEIETPLLVRATPEGARDYVVPSRVSPGKFYALPQSPQLYKQILMVSGCDRYYQVARCLRDEDLRADRQPEHTQFDLEMSFVTSDDIMEFVEGMYKNIVKDVKNVELPNFPKITYKEAMDKYGSDKPDIRFELFLHDVSEIAVKSDFGVFKDVVANGGIIKCINPQHDFPRKEIDGLILFTQELGAKGMAWLRVTENGLESNIAKYFSAEVQKELIAKIDAKPGSVIMFIAGKQRECNDILCKLRIELAKRMKLFDENELKFCWIVDFPMYSWDEDSESWSPEHHMFTMPKEECLKYLETDPGKVVGDLYDLVLNGTELGSGSIRITNPELQKRIMKVIGLDEKEAEKKFGFLLKAYKYGGPVHGGMGLGVDRFTAMMIGTNDIREVIAFPKNKNAECPMDGCPSDLDDKQLKELHIKIDVVKKENK